jgi:hypothetical protein
MSAGIEIYNYVSNQKGTPALYSDILANRPAAGFLGRLFISTDTLEIYRDTGTAWALISGGGGGSVNIYNSDGTLTAARTVTMAGHNLTFEGGAGTNRIRMSADAGQPRIFSFASANVARWAFRVDGAETGSNAGGDWALRAYNDSGTFTFSPIAANRKTGEKTLFAQANITAGTEAVTSVFNIAGITYASGLTMIGGNAHAAQFNNFTLANSGSLTFANSSFVGANGNVLRLQANNSGTITMQAATPGLRTAAVSLNQIQYNTTNGSAITYTHAANIQGLGILRLFAAGSLTVTNAYGLLINDLNEYGYASTGAGALSITNRWGIYQDSTTDANYLGGSVLIGTTTNAGYKTDINGTFRAVSTVTLSSLGGVGTRMVVADASGVLSTQAIPGGGGGITGSGTTNYVPKFTTSTSIGDSQIVDNGVSGVNVGTRLLIRDNGPFITGANLSSFGNNFAIGTTGVSSIQFFTNNISTVLITGSQTVGINATAALLPLTVFNPVLNTPVFEVRGGGGSSQSRMQFTFGTASASTLNGDIFASTTDFALRGEPGRNVWLGNSVSGAVVNRFNIFPNGNIGVNTTTDAGYRTDINGNLRTTQHAYFATSSGGVVIGSTAAPATELDIYGSTSLSIGTCRIQQLLYSVEAYNTTPNASLGFVNKFNSSGSYTTMGAISVGKENTGDGSAQGYMSFLTWGPSSLTVKQQITSGGNILMGTTTDSGQRLQVAGTARIYGTALPHLLIEQTAATGNVELQFSATDASYPAIIRSKAAQSIAFKDGTNSNLDIYSAGQLSIGGGGAPFGSTNTLTVLAGTAPTATASDCFTLYSKDITAGNAAPHFITENGAIVKIYQETTSVAAAAFTANSGTAINDASTFDGYTLRQIVKALRNLGILQ